jgi:hypothetical protein
LSNETNHHDERRCPLCGEINQCGAESGDCWCFHSKVPMALREQIPTELRGKSCICRKCVEDFKAQES